LALAPVVEGNGGQRANVIALLKRLHQRRRRRALRSLARLLAELDLAAGQIRQKPARASRISVSSAR
jgi:hypothetical protein